jgi:hypothetical protein
MLPDRGKIRKAGFLRRRRQPAMAGVPQNHSTVHRPTFRRPALPGMARLFEASRHDSPVAQQAEGPSGLRCRGPHRAECTASLYAASHQWDIIMAHRVVGECGIRTHPPPPGRPELTIRRGSQQSAVPGIMAGADLKTMAGRRVWCHAIDRVGLGEMRRLPMLHVRVRQEARGGPGQGLHRRKVCRRHGTRVYRDRLSRL